MPFRQPGVGNIDTKSAWRYNISENIELTMYFVVEFTGVTAGQLLISMHFISNSRYIILAAHFISSAFMLKYCYLIKSLLN